MSSDAAASALPARAVVRLWSPRARAGAAAVLALALLALGLVLGVQPSPRGGPPGDDSILYLRVIDDVRAGQGYYAAAVREQRTHGYPVRPFVTVRTPVLAEALALLPGPLARRAAAALLALCVAVAWAVRLRAEAKRPLGAALGLLLLLGAAAAGFYPKAYAQHELWSGLLLSLGIAVYGARSWPVSLVLVLAAAAIRELAAPVLPLMALMAFADGRRREAAAWAAGLVLAAGFIGLHALQVIRLTTPADLGSSGWLALGGWPFVLLQMKWNALLLAMPAPVIALAASLAVFGLSGLQDPARRRAAATVAAYGAAFLVLGRPDNAYWGLMIASLWPVSMTGIEPAAAALLKRPDGRIQS